MNNPLDSKRVPVYYLKFIIYHEMLHADLGVAPILSHKGIQETGEALQTP